MSMYLPNPDLYPTGDEAAEFLEIPPMAQSAAGAGITVEREDGATLRVDPQTQLDIGGSS